MRPEDLSAALKATDLCIEWMPSIVSQSSDQKPNASIDRGKHGNATGKGDSKRGDDPDFPEATLILGRHFLVRAALS